MTWQETALDEVAQHIGRGKSPVYEDDSSFYVLNQACIQHGYLDLGKLKSVSETHFQGLDSIKKTSRGDVFVNSTGTGTLGRIAYWDSDLEVAFDGHVTLVRLLPEYDSRFFYYWLHMPEAQSQILNDCISGSTNQIELSREAFRKIRIRHPSSKAEQTAIADILATVDRAIAQSEALIAKQRRIKAGLLHDLLTRGIDAQGNLRHPSTHRFKPSPVGPVPEEWEVGLLDTVAEIGSGVTLGRSVSGSDVVELPYLRVANVQDGYIDLSDIKTVHIYRHEIPRFLLQPGDVLMNEGGDYDKLGRGAVWRGQIAPCLHQNHVFRVRANPTRLLPDFLALVSASPYGRRFFIVSSKQSTNLASINSTQLKSFPVPLPSIEEQETIVEILGVSDAAVDAEDTRRLKLQRLKTGLMQDLLSGRVSVEKLLT